MLYNPMDLFFKLYHKHCIRSKWSGSQFRRKKNTHTEYCVLSWVQKKLCERNRHL